MLGICYTGKHGEKKNVCNKLPSVTNVKGVVCLGLHPKILQTFKVTEYSVFGCRDLISAL